MTPDILGPFLPGTVKTLLLPSPCLSPLLLPFWRGPDSSKPQLLQLSWHEHSAVLFSGCSSDYWQTKNEQAAESTPLVST